MSSLLNPAPPGLFSQPPPPGGSDRTPLRSREPLVIGKKCKRRWKRLPVFYLWPNFYLFPLTRDVTVGQNGSIFDRFRKSLITRELFDLELIKWHQCVCLDPRIRMIYGMTLKGQMVTLTLGQGQILTFQGHTAYQSNPCIKLVTMTSNSLM